MGIAFAPPILRAGKECRMTEASPEPAITHPEEMRANFNLRIGEKVFLRGDARLTPAGIVTAGLMTVAVLIAATALVRAARR